MIDNYSKAIGMLTALGMNDCCAEPIINDALEVIQQHVKSLEEEIEWAEKNFISPDEILKASYLIYSNEFYGTISTDSLGIGEKERAEWLKEHYPENYEEWAKAHGYEDEKSDEKEGEDE